MAQALHIQARKKARHLAHKSLSMLFSPPKNPKAIEIQEIKRILLVRINYRIGNILFTTPLLNALEKKFPNAKIDVMVGASFTAPLLENMPQVSKVYAFPRALLKQPLKMLKLKKELKNNAYDLLIAPSLSSSSDSLFTSLVSATYKVGFVAPDVFSPLTHGVAFPKDVFHEALKPLALMSAFGDEDYEKILDIRLSQAEKEVHQKEIPPKSIGIFRDARGGKKLDKAFWLALEKALLSLDKSFFFIDILDPNNTEPLSETIHTLSEKNLRVLASKIANLDAFICADTGPMHLSSASLTPTIALFKKTSPKYYGTLGSKDLSLVMKEKSIEDIAKEIYEHLEKVRG